MREEFPKPKINTFDFRSDLTSIALLYSDVFADPPWNEYTKCPGCQNFFGKNTEIGLACPKGCRIELTAAYPLEETKKYIGGEVSNSSGTGLVIRASTETVAFAWGYSFPSPTEFANDKYHSSRAAQLAEERLRESKITGRFFYISEVGVKKEYRGKGWSNCLTGRLIEVAELNNLPIVMRTNHESPMVRVAKRFDMSLIMGNGTDVTDFENDNRVLFVKPNSLKRTSL